MINEIRIGGSGITWEVIRYSGASEVWKARPVVYFHYTTPAFWYSKDVLNNVPMTLEELKAMIRPLDRYAKFSQNITYTTSPIVTKEGQNREKIDAIKFTRGAQTTGLVVRGNNPTYYANFYCSGKAQDGRYIITATARMGARYVDE